MANHEEASWGSFLKGCLVITLIFGSIVGGFLYFKQKSDNADAQIEQTVMRPYWDALAAGDYSRAHSLRAESWSSKHTAEELEKAYSKAEESHGTLLKTYIHVANRFYEPGAELQTMRVETFYEFKDGGRYRVVFVLERPSDSDPWQIGSSTVPLSHGLGDGPY